MKRDSKVWFKTKGLDVPIPSVSLALNENILIILFTPWIYAGMKFSVMGIIFATLSTIF